MVQDVFLGLLKMLTRILKTLAAFVVILQAGKGAPSGTETRLCLIPYNSSNITSDRPALVYYDVGKRGLCGKDQIFLPIPDDFNKNLLRGGALGSDFAYFANELSVPGTRLHFDLLNDQTNAGNYYDCQEGYCVWNNPQHPCHGLPANQRYSNETKLCHTLGLRNYCPKNQIFYAQLEKDLDTLYGECDCFPTEQFWFDPNDGNCYAPFTQGFCLDSQWLTINRTTGRVECEPASCPNDGKHVYWTEGFQKCFLQGETGPCDSYRGQTLGLHLGVVECIGRLGSYPYFPSISPHLPYFPSLSPMRTISHFEIDGQEDLFSHRQTRSFSRGCLKKGSKWSQSSACRNWFKITPNPCGLGKFSQTLQRCV